MIEVENTSAPSDKFQDLRMRFFDFEIINKLFDSRIHNIAWWEKIRYSLFHKIACQNNVLQEVNPPPPTALHKRGVLKLKSATSTLRSIRRLPRADVLIFGRNRRLLGPDGLLWDSFTDPIIPGLEELGHRVLVIWKPKPGTPTHPVPTPALYSLSGIYKQKIGVIRRFELPNWRLVPADRNHLDQISTKLANEFGFRFNLGDHLEWELAKWAAQRRVYNQILDQVQPQLAIVLVSNPLHSFIKACWERDIPVVELQHGLVGPSYLGYSFPPGVKRTVFPDRFLAFGEYWCEAANFAVESERLFPVGFPWFEEQVKNLHSLPGRKEVLFLSQRTIGPQLGKLAIATRKLLGPEWQIRFKLHPLEYGDWKERHQELALSDIELITNDNKPLYAQLSSARLAVGVYSTSLVEAIGLGTPVGIADLPGSEALAPLVGRGAAHRIGSPDDIVEALNSKFEPVDPEIFFRSGSKQRILKLLDGWIKNPKSARYIAPPSAPTTID